jgi:hypothetical protein
VRSAGVGLVARAARDGLQGFTIEGMAVALDLNNTFGSLN